MEIAGVVLVACGVPFALGAVVRRWWLLWVLLGVGVLSLIAAGAAPSNGEASGESFPPLAQVVLWLVLVVAPAGLLTALGIALGHPLAPSRPRQSGAPSNSDVRPYADES
jgi:hypothetical protein